MGPEERVHAAQVSICLRVSISPLMYRTVGACVCSLVVIPVVTAAGYLEVSCSKEKRREPPHWKRIVLLHTVAHPPDFGDRLLNFPNKRTVQVERS